MRRRPAAAALAAALAAVGAPGAAAAPVPPGRLVTLDAFADPGQLGHFGALFEADPHAAPDAPVRALSSSGQLYLAADLAFRADRSIVVVDRDADPSGYGPDPNGDAGPGAVFLAAADDQAIGVLSDGSDLVGGLPPGTRSVFVDPRAVAIAPDGRILVVDSDADPSDLGPDGAGFAGHGALLAVDPATGVVELVSDGTLSPAGPAPSGSWFEDPGGVALAAGGTVAYVLDLAADPLGIGTVGAVFEVEIATGSVRVVGTSTLFEAPVAIAAAPDGSLRVTDQLVDFRGDGSRGALFAVRPDASDPVAATAVELTDPRFRGPAGVHVTPDGSAWIADPFATPLGPSRIGAVFRAVPGEAPRVASSATSYRALAAVRASPPQAPPPTLSGVTPARVDAGTAATLLVSGTGLDPAPEVRAGAGVAVQAVRGPSATSIEADVVVDAAAAPGSRPLVVVNPDFQAATLPAAFEVVAPLAPLVTSCDPPAGVQGTVVRVSVLGDRFEAGSTLDVGPGVAASNLVVVDTTRLEADLAVDPAALPGPRTVTVTLPSGRSGSAAGAFSVIEPAPPRPDAVEPDAAPRDRTLDLVVDGTGFVPGTTFDLGPGVTVGPPVVAGPFEARLRVHVRADADPGPRDVVARAPDGRTGTLVAGFAVASAPALRIAAVRLDDAATGNGNGSADPGEVLALDVTVANVGDVDASGLGVRVADPSPGLGLEIVRPVVTFPPVAAGASARRAGAPYPEVRLADDLACGAAVPIDVEVLAAGVPVTTLRTAVRLGRLDGRARKPVLDGAEVGGAMGGAVALADVDGDGVADVVAAAPAESPAGLFAAGRIVATSGLTDDPLWTLLGTSLGGRLGSALASAGDVDGDGAEDLLAGEPGWERDAGRLVLVSGRTGAIVAESPGTADERLGSAVALLGDRDLDGDADVLAGAPGPPGGAGAAVVLDAASLDLVERVAGNPGERLGFAVAGLGDVDGDGRADAAVGAPGSGSGRVLAWLTSDPSRDVVGRDAGEAFGTALAAGQDASGDGWPDLVVGAPLASVPASGAGRVDLVSPREATTIRSWHGEAAGDEAGRAVALTSDGDSDDLPDVAYGSPGAGGDDGAVVVRSSATGRLVEWIVPARGGAGRLGSALAAGRDAGGDGVADLVAGEPRAGLPGLPLAGRAAAWKSRLACTPVRPCTADALEPNDAAAPAPVALGAHAGLSVCRLDEDAFRLDLDPLRRGFVRIRFTHAWGDLDAELRDASGARVEASASLDDDEELGPFGPGGTWTIVVTGFDGATNDYTLEVVDPDSCAPAQPLRGLAVSKAGAGRTVITWAPSQDPCHAPPPARGYALHAGPSPRLSPADPFPAGSSFEDASHLDLDGDALDPRHVEDVPGTRYYLVVDRGARGELGPASP